MKNFTTRLGHALTFERALALAAAFVLATSAFALMHAFRGAEYSGLVTLLVGA